MEATVARYYDPSTAQFLTRDPLEDETGEPYSYAGDDPIDNSDPSGLHWWNSAYDWTVQNLDPVSYVLPYYAEEWDAASSGCGFWDSFKYGAEGTGVAALQTIAGWGAGRVAGWALGPLGDWIGSRLAGSGLSIEASDGTLVKGFTNHGMNRVIGDGAKRAGVTPQALLDALKNPVGIRSGVDDLGRPFKIYTGTDARVVVNPTTGQVVSVNPLSGAGANR